MVIVLFPCYLFTYRISGLIDAVEGGHCEAEGSHSQEACGKRAAREVSDAACGAKATDAGNDAEDLDEDAVHVSIVGRGRNKSRAIYSPLSLYFCLREYLLASL
jgi:hypothetical protein